MDETPDDAAPGDVETDYAQIIKDAPPTLITSSGNVYLPLQYTQPGDKEYTKEAHESAMAQEELARKKISNREADLDIFLRSLWALLLALVLLLVIGFQDILLWCVGAGKLTFNKYPGLIHVFVGENFVQVIGLCFVVVKYLFPTKREDKKKAEGRKDALETAGRPGRGASKPRARSTAPDDESSD